MAGPLAPRRPRRHHHGQRQPPIACRGAGAGPREAGAPIEAVDSAPPAASPKKPHHRSVGRSRYAIAAEAIAAGRLPHAAPVVTSAANRDYQKHFDKLFGLAKAGDWDAVRDYPVTGSNSYSKMVARYREDLPRRD